MSQSNVRRHSLKLSIKFLLTNDLGTPLHKVVLKHSFVELVEKVRHKGLEDVRKWEMGSEGGEDWSKSFVSVLLLESGIW